jgi:ABC-type Mn2+/Zn2+ transport system permease subunit
LQTLFFKFSGSEESVYIFTQMGIEPWGRYLTGVLEGIAGMMLLIRGLSGYGAGIGLAIISGAIFSHLTILGTEVMGDGGYLFGLAIVVFICCAIVLWFRKDDILTLFRKIKQ